MSFGQFPVTAVVPSLAEIEAAYNYITSKISAIRALPGQLHQKQMEAAEVVRQTGDADARALMQQFAALKLEASELVGKIDGIKTSVPGLGVAPAVLIAAGAVIIAVAYAASVIFRKKSEFERQLELIETSQMTPEQVIALRESTPIGGIGGALANLGSTMKWAILGAVALTVLPLVAKGLK